MTTNKKVLEVLQFIVISKAAGLDEISGDSNIAKLKPLYKKGSKANPEDFRPISLLPLLSKVIKRIVYDQEIIFYSKIIFCTIINQDLGKKHSNDLCLSFLNDKILKGFDKGLFTGMILIDLQKAFDTTNYEILLGKLHAIGFSEKTVAWFKSYLSDRTFKVDINNHFSDLSKISCGIPQGSILGLPLFLLYVNDMSQTVHSDLFLYGDDSGLTFQHKDVHTIEHQLNKDFANLCEWFVDNKLSVPLGEEKTKCIFFGSKLKLKNAGKLNIMYNRIEIN